MYNTHNTSESDVLKNGTSHKNKCAVILDISQLLVFHYVTNQ